MDERLWREPMLRRLLADALIVAVAFIVVHPWASADAAVTPKSCDGKTAQRHVERGRALVRHGYSESRLIDTTPMKGSEKRAMQEHKFCVVGDDRERIAKYRERMAAKYKHKLYEAAPWMSPAGKKLVRSLSGTLAAIRSCESGGDYDTNTGNSFYGAYQFTWGTWRSMGGHGYASDASPAEQDYRAALLYSRQGSSPWPVCGV